MQMFAISEVCSDNFMQSQSRLTLEFLRWQHAKDYLSKLRTLENYPDSFPCTVEEACYIKHSSKLVYASADSYRGHELEQYTLSKIVQLKGMISSPPIFNQMI